MKILAIESSAKAAGAAVLCDGKLTSEQFVNNGLTHSRTLMELIDAALRTAGMTVSDMDAVAVDVGPGSFTGLRIGLGTAKGLAFGADKPIIAVPSLQGLIYTAGVRDGIVVPMMDARRGEVYTAVYKMEAGTPHEVMEMQPMPLSELLPSLENALFVGDGAEVHREKILEVMGARASFAPPHLLHQHASGIAMAAQHLPMVSAHEAAPIYLRLSQAEREKMEA